MLSTVRIVEPASAVAQPRTTPAGAVADPVSPPAGADSSRGFAPRLTRRYVLALVASPDSIMPLLTPSGESRWAVGWNPHILDPGRDASGEGGLFVTGEPGPDGSLAGMTLWTLTRFDRDQHRVEYFHCTPGSDAVHLRIHLEGDGAGGAHAEVTYSWTALGPDGEKLLAKQTEDRFQARMQHWEMALNHYLRTGKQITLPGH